jgi:hypothetical protein
MRKTASTTQGPTIPQSNHNSIWTGKVPPKWVTHYIPAIYPRRNQISNQSFWQDHEVLYHSLRTSHRNYSTFDRIRFQLEAPQLERLKIVMASSSTLTHLECSNCSKHYSKDHLWNLCQDCKKPLTSCYDLQKAKETLTKEGNNLK